MNIAKPDMTSGNRTAVHQVQRLSGKAMSPKGMNATPSDYSLGERLARIFTSSGMAVSPETLGTLEVSLLSIGIASSELDSVLALKALMLHRASLPVTRASLVGRVGADGLMTGRVWDLLSIAQSLLTGTVLTGETRSVVETFVRNLEGYFETGEAPFTPAALRDLFMKSGLFFEWRLLSWYRSGKDQSVLAALVRSDLKGILMNFLGRLKSHSKGSAVRRKLETLEEESSAVLRAITSDQLEFLAGGPDGVRAIPMDIPFDSGRGKGGGRIHIRFEKRKKQTGSEGDTCSLMFTVEPSGLGRLGVAMILKGRNCSVHLTCSEHKTMLLAGDMRVELMDALVSRGFTVSALGLSEGPVDDNGDNCLNGFQSLDVVG